MERLNYAIITVITMSLVSGWFLIIATPLALILSPVFFAVGYPLYLISTKLFLVGSLFYRSLRVENLKELLSPALELFEDVQCACVSWNQNQAYVTVFATNTASPWTSQVSTKRAVGNGSGIIRSLMAKKVEVGCAQRSRCANFANCPNQGHEGCSSKEIYRRS